MRCLSLLVLLGCTGSETISGEPAPTPPPDPYELAHRFAMLGSGRVATEIDCESSPYRYLCPAAGLEQAALAERGDLDHPLVGLYVQVRASRSLSESAKRTAGVSMLTWDDDGARLRRFKGALVTGTAGFLGRYLRGELDEWPMDPTVWDQLQAEPMKGRPTRTDDHGVVWDGEYPTRLYRMTDRPGGDVLVAVQDVGAGGYLHVLPLEGMLLP